MKTHSTFVLFATVLVACGGSKDAPPKGKGDGTAKPVLASSGDVEGLDMRVSEGQQGKPAIDRAQLAPAKPLAENEVNALLARAKPIASEATDVQGFALRAKSQPPPKTGQTIQGQFPPDPSTLLPPSPADAAKELTVLRFSTRARSRSRQSSPSRSVSRWSP
jgi:hypothetical protein